MTGKKNRHLYRLSTSIVLAAVLTAAGSEQALAAVEAPAVIGPQYSVKTGPGAEIMQGNAAAVPKVISHTVRELFDAEYYRMLYPDLAALGDDAEALYRHFISYGLKEQRKCSPYLDLARYIAENEDLRKAFGDNTDAYVAHYFTLGIDEGRDAGASGFDIYLQSILKTADTIDRKLYGQALLNYSLLQSQNGKSSRSTGDSDEGAGESGNAGIGRGSSGTDILIDKDTVAVPWDYVANGYVTLDMIREHCGDNLILVQNKQGDVTFLAGDISSRSVTDGTSALEAVKSFFGVLKLDDEENLYLSLNSTKADSEGNTVYEFLPTDQESGMYAETITDVEKVKKSSQGKYQAVVRLKAGSDGTVIALTSTSEGSYTRYQALNDEGKVIDSRSQGIYSELSEEVKENYRILGDYTRNYQNDMLYQQAYFAESLTGTDKGSIGILYYNFANGTDLFYKIDQEVYESAGGEASYPLDYLLTKATYQDMTLTDCHGNKVTVPVAYVSTGKDGEQDTGYYYLASRDDNTIMFLQPGTESAYSWSENSLVKLKMDQNGVLSPDDSSLNMGELVTMYSDILDARRYFKSVDPQKSDSEPYIINYFYENTFENAAGTDSYGLMGMNFYDCYLNRSYGTAIHEVTHSMTMNQYFPSYTNYNGAISEGYADIIGLCLTQKKYNELVSDYMAENNAALEEAQKYVSDNFEDCSATWYKGYFKDGRGKIVYDFDSADPYKNHEYGYNYATAVGDEGFGYYPDEKDPTYDDYNCHCNSSVLTHIAYEMYHNDIVSDPEELADIWYDTVNYLTGESEFYDVRYYVEETMKEHGCSAEEIAKTDALFEDANVTVESRDQDLLATPEERKAENNLSEASENSANIQQNTQEDKQAAFTADIVNDVAGTDF